MNAEEDCNTVAQVFDESLVERANGHLIRLRELGGRMAVGQKGSVSYPNTTRDT